MISTTLYPQPDGWVRVAFHSGRRPIGRPAIIPDVRQVATPEGRRELARMVGVLHQLSDKDRR